MNRNEIIEAKLNEWMSDAIDIVNKGLENDTFYLEQKTLMEKYIASNDMDSMLEYQTTVQNIEVEEAYKAGHNDCIAYLIKIGKLT